MCLGCFTVQLASTYECHFSDLIRDSSLGTNCLHCLFGCATLPIGFPWFCRSSVMPLLCNLSPAAFIYSRFCQAIVGQFREWCPKPLHLKHFKFLKWSISIVSIKRISFYGVGIFGSNCCRADCTLLDAAWNVWFSIFLNILFPLFMFNNWAFLLSYLKWNLRMEGVEDGLKYRGLRRCLKYF